MKKGELSITVTEIVRDLQSALNLLGMAGPNPLACQDEKEYWKTLHELQNKYLENEEDEG